MSLGVILSCLCFDVFLRPFYSDELDCWQRKGMDFSSLWGILCLFTGGLGCSSQQEQMFNGPAFANGPGLLCLFLTDVPLQSAHSGVTKDFKLGGGRARRELFSVYYDLGIHKLTLKDPKICDPQPCAIWMRHKFGQCVVEACGSCSWGRGEVTTGILALWSPWHGQICVSW